MSTRTALAAFWREIAHETRRHAGDERLPPALRARLRGATNRALERSRRLGPPPARYRRRTICDTPPAADRAEKARALAAAEGVAEGVPIVVMAARRPSDAYIGVSEALRQDGCHVLHQPAPDQACLAGAWFVLTDSEDIQRAAEAMGTPVLAVNLDDAFTAYPVRHDGLLALRHAVDLDTGRAVPLSARLTEGYYRNLRNIGFRGLTAAELLDTVREMTDGLRHGWRESEGQRRFRDRVVDAGRVLAARVPAVAASGPDDGFIGDGRLARLQADQ